MTKIELWIGNNEYTIDGEVFKMDVAPEIKNSRTMVPVRFIAEAFDKDVFWNEKERKVVIKDK